MGCVKVDLVSYIQFRTLRLPGRGCDPTLIRFYLAEVNLFIGYSIDHISNKLSTQHCSPHPP